MTIKLSKNIKKIIQTLKKHQLTSNNSDIISHVENLLNSRDYKKIEEIV